MASEESRYRHVLDKVPFISHHQRHQIRRSEQDAWFRANSSDEYLDHDPTVLEWMKSVKPTRFDVLFYLADTFPCSKWLFNYNLQWLMGDLVAGLTVGAVIIPQAMAYAKLANLPVEFGLYTSFIGGLIYWVFGTSKDINIGPVAVASIVTGSMVAEVAHEFPDQTKAFIAGSIAMLAGATVALLGILRLGWLVDLIALPAVCAFISGSAITICFGQTPILLGIKGISSRDPAYAIAINTFKKLGSAKLDAAVGITALLMLYLIKWACEYYGTRKPKWSKTIFFASTLRTIITILIFILISYGVNRSHKEKPLFQILGFIPRGLQRASPPKLNGEMVKVFMGQVPAAVVVLIIEHISIGKSFGRINNYTINPNSELLAIGVTNIIGPMLGAYASTGSTSRTAINAKAGSRTPMAGVFTAALVILALYTLTPVLFFTPNSVLAAVIIHALGDLITPPSTLFEFWRVCPLDIVIFVVGFVITIFNNIENGIFAMIALSLLIQFFRMFKAHGIFLGRASIRTIEKGKEANESYEINGDPAYTALRSVFLPLDRHDGSNPRIDLENPYPGIFIYRFTEGFNYPNANNHLDYLTKVIKSETRPTSIVSFANPGDRPWNDPAPRRKVQNTIPDNRPTLKAVILDFSAVGDVDITSIQALIDCRNLFDRYAAPKSVQWHFACIHSRWAKRALASAGFGFPSFDTTNGQPQHFKPIYSLAEQAKSASPENSGDIMEVGKGKSRADALVEDIEMGDIISNQESKMVVNKIEFSTNDKLMSEQVSNMSVVYGINRPFFHVDISSALFSAIANEEHRINMEGNQSEI